MKLTMYRCEQCGDLIKDESSRLILANVVVERNDGTFQACKADRPDFCGPGCLVRYLSDKINPGVEATKFTEAMR